MSFRFIECLGVNRSSNDLIDLVNSFRRYSVEDCALFGITGVSLGLSGAYLCLSYDHFNRGRISQATKCLVGAIPCAVAGIFFSFHSLNRMSQECIGYQISAGIIPPPLN